SPKLARLQRFHQDADLGDGLAVFIFPIRIHDDAAATPATDVAVLGQHAADGDGAIHIAARIDVEQRAAVQPALGDLQLVDDLHRADLGRPGYRAAGEAGGQ